ncbi:MAG: ubiquinone/menaquinone biosynthesis methyltransferase [Oligoflexia bacterium]|nr:ubiquinone/menaquinone biosynthesis methyltransferase [Oligoflexia bacterium]
MFDKISTTYDFLNHALSFGIDIHWRRVAAALVMDHYESNKNNKCSKFSMLDIATGTGDLLFAILKNKSAIEFNVTAIDLETSMIELAKKKFANRRMSDFFVDFRVADAVAVADPEYKSESFDIITSAFGVRNFYDLDRGLANIHRMLKMGGQVVILEFSAEGINPIFKPFFIPYLNFFVPFVGGLISKDFKAYDYLNKSARSFPCGEKFVSILEKANFLDVKMIPLTFGLVTIYIGKKR